jgi:hypothetical protein
MGNLSYLHRPRVLHCCYGILSPCRLFYEPPEVEQVDRFIVKMKLHVVGICYDWHGLFWIGGCLKMTPTKSTSCSPAIMRRELICDTIQVPSRPSNALPSA